MTKRNFSETCRVVRWLTMTYWSPLVIDLSISQKLEDSYWLRNAREVTTINYKPQDAIVPGDQRDTFGDDDIFVLIKEICLSSKSFRIFPALHKTHAIINPI